jgi:penicillin-binding protein 2
MSAVGANSGSVVAINPQNGEVLAMVSIPTYNNNLFAKGISNDDYQKLINDSGKPLFNRAVSGTYPSGSTIKPFMASAGLQESVITTNTTINDSGEIAVGNYVYHDWKAHGLVSVSKAIAESCDVFFYAVGGGWDKIKGLGVAKIDDYLTKFGFGGKLGIDIPGEAGGLVPSPKWKEQAKNESWYLGDTYHMSIGQGDFLVTPLQLANATAAIANGGQVLKPYIVKEIKDNNGTVVKITEKTVLNQNFISSDNIEAVRSGMRLAVTSGTARQFNDLPVAIAAKTGTAQFGDSDKTHAWMTAFGPYNDPKIAVAVLIEGGGEGYAAAGPVTKDILNWYFSH